MALPSQLQEGRIRLNLKKEVLYIRTDGQWKKLLGGLKVLP